MRRRSKTRNTMTEKQNRQLAGAISFHLDKTYPGHLWAVNVADGIVTVKNMFLSGAMGFTVGILDLDTHLHKITMAGGEILERYRLKRAALNLDDLKGKKRDFAGRLQFDA